MSTVAVSGDGVALLYAAIILLLLTWITVSIRLGVRVWRKVLGMDDYLMLVGLVLFSVTACLCIVSCFYGSGQKAKDLKPLTISKGIKTFYIAEYFYVVSAAMIKCSISVTLLRIASRQCRYNWSIYAIMGLQWIATIVFIASIASICKPIQTLWGEAKGTCNLRLNSNASFFFSAIEILTDWSLAILPAIMLWKVQMKGTVKSSVAVILALASVASCATIVRLRYLALYSDPGEFMYSTGKIGFWSLMEEGIGIVAGSLPALRPLLSLRVGFSSSMNTPAGGISGPPESLSYNRHDRKRSGVMMMDTFQTFGDGADREDEHDDGDSQKNIVKETKYSVTSTKVAISEEERIRGQALGGSRR
ncbi:uncharacterized protein M421DRAFT_424012 [Didymella exigua CBS 183.55]|uniref:Rhodopsin domain-containing protein n=1 Tax=Didymella exigua CBS 183.55 TaxID=1150837 RepID=A0A6A5RAE8_9PLEO|nr:uncharacterized protein M421DRAFT_424012 [Didymella exigua CBS 183.55]KAF1925215.1 hypothetical protein M421DRAFT_424012 [Didymella exigua CBS 183.55]